MPRILALSGSSRSGSINTAVLNAAVKHAASAGAEIEVLDLGALNLPIYNGDLEASEAFPAGATELKEKLRSADGVLICCPEYNSMVTPLLLNALDWASRPGPDARDAAPVFGGRVAGIAAASPGPLGGMRALAFLRSFLQNLGMVVVPTNAAVGSVRDGFFAEDGSFADPKSGGRVFKMVDELIHWSQHRG